MKDKTNSSHSVYWQSTLSLTAKLLLIWFFVSFSCGIIFKDSTHDAKSGHYISCVRMKSNQRDITDEWWTYDDAKVSTGLPPKDEYYPVLYTFERIE